MAQGIKRDERGFWFWEKVRYSEGCWEWQGKFERGGYGNMYTAETPHGATTMAHRFAFMMEVGAIPPGKQIDHLCLNRACVRPDHLEVVSPAVNTRRAKCSADPCTDDDRCWRGHELTPENVRFYMSSRGKPFGQCKECVRINQRTQYWRRKERQQ